MLDPNDYFSFEFQTLEKLFDQKYVWDIVKNISSYIKTLPLGKIEVPIPNGVYLENSSLISIGEGTILEPGCYIKGPAWIGKGCKIKHASYIRENVILADGSVVGHGSEVKNSILLPGAHAAHFNYVGDSILGSDTNLGAGVKCANIRLDRKEITIRKEKEKIGTGLIKLGLILGDRSQIGCNSVTNPGTLIGKDSFCPPGTVLKGCIFQGER